MAHVLQQGTVNECMAYGSKRQGYAGFVGCSNTKLSVTHELTNSDGCMVLFLRQLKEDENSTATRTQ